LLSQPIADPTTRTDLCKDKGAPLGEVVESAFNEANTFLFASLMILIFGAGLFSLDRLVAKRINSRIGRSELAIAV
jgi:hypothetical protein